MLLSFPLDNPIVAWAKCDCKKNLKKRLTISEDMRRWFQERITQVNIEDLTIKQARELAGLFSTTTQSPKTHPFVGKYVVVRTYSAGVHVGVLEQAGEGEAILADTRRIWSWSGALSLSEISARGITSGKVSVAVRNNALTGVIEIIPTTGEAEVCLRNFSAFKA